MSFSGNWGSSRKSDLKNKSASYHHPRPEAHTPRAHTPNCSMDVPKDQLSALLDQGLYASAQMLGCFAVSSTTINPETSPHLKAENLALYGDSLFREKEYGRAIFTVEVIGDDKKQNVATPPTTRSALSASNRSSSPNSCNTPTINENEVKFKIATCHSALGENRAALAEMEGIPSKSRNLEMNLMLAKLYRNSRHTRAAIGCFKECLRNCPYIIEAIIALAELSVSSKDIISLFPQTPNRSGKHPSDQIDSSRWLQRYVEAQCCIASNDYKGGLELFSELLQRFPNNIHILLEMAKVKAVTGKNDEAILDFEKVRSLDPYVVTYMDEYAMLLKLKSDHSKLNKLVHDLLNIDPAKPEVYVALSVLWEKKDERGALSYAEKSIRVDERHVAGYIMKGNLYLSMNRPDAAVIAYRGAQELRPDLRSFQGLVRSYLALSKVKEALYVAREAMKAMPQSAKALKLVGDVHASNTSGRDKAKKFYESALRLEPGFLGSALALAELHVMEGRNKDAVTLLERYLKDWADDSLHVKLAQVFAATNMLQDALSHYQAALRINFQNEAAKKGLERLEKQMKGVDPDAPEDDEDNEVDDADGDQEEAELL
ncbi:anaphase-promoting complex subunit 7 [Phtheirospermum japonicum]|uniref:Anaphase-promoting complex subunit 7 n=1 Tax=Phtheirospermum japonicum TaxID=374723 RepID=A0A830BIN0_9LAMI|nr:anaphase-promoting complex subunit 7 [Phtheirospermum japonicum]